MTTNNSTSVKALLLRTKDFIRPSSDKTKQ
jgi:hypothetical protein